MVQEASIRVVPGGWGDAGLVEITGVLHDGAEQLLRHFPDSPPLEIEVARAPDNQPRVAYRHDPAHPYPVFLEAEGRHWPRFAYQFTHELTHILMGYERLRHRENHWLHECLCDTAAWFAVERMGESWAHSAPFIGWEGESVRFQDYLNQAGGTGDPRGAGALGQWLATYEDRLRRNPYMRPLNQTAVLEFLPLFRNAPEHWPAVACLPDSPAPLAQYLAEWRAACPDMHVPMVDAIATLFDLGCDGVIEEPDSKLTH